MNFIPMLIKENYVKSFCDMGNWYIMCVERGGRKNTRSGGSLFTCLAWFGFWVAWNLLCRLG